MFQTLNFMRTMILGIDAKRQSEKGATAVEYGLLVALIAAMIVTVLLLLGPQLVETFQKVVDSLTTANAA
jgi:pilus assembly protein Flp/PilA